MVQRYSARAGIGRLACDLMNSAFDEIPGSNPQSAEAIGDAITQLLRHSLLERSGLPTELSHKEALRDRIKAYIERNLRDPGLSIDQIADAFHCSKRNLHKTFSDDGATLSETIWRQRLERCRRDLVAPSCAWKSITEIVFSWGFNSSTHFSKAFKETYGITPSLHRLKERTVDSAPALLPQEAGESALRSPALRSVLRTLELPEEYCRI